MLGIGCGVWSAWIPSSVRMEVVVGVEPDASADCAPRCIGQSQAHNERVGYFLLSQKYFLLSEYTYSTVFYPYSTRILHISQN